MADAEVERLTAAARLLAKTTRTLPDFGPDVCTPQRLDNLRDAQRVIAERLATLLGEETPCPTR